MNKVNYDKIMQSIILDCQKENTKPKLLLHSCCAPCSTACIERLKDYFDLTVYYFNPNIDTLEEYQKRLNEQIKYCQQLNIKVIGEEFQKELFLSAVTGKENEKEGGARCSVCFNLRLTQTAKKAREEKFDFFATTLTVSPLKNATLINEIGLEIEKDINVKYLPTDFKKGGGYLRSIEISKENGLYRQNYCGCEFSKR